MQCILPALFEIAAKSRTSLAATSRAALVLGMVAVSPAIAEHSEASSNSAQTEPGIEANWIVDYEASKIAFAGQYNGEAFSGEIKSWSANINWDPDAPETGAVDVTIDTSSISTGNQSYDGTLSAGEWIDPDSFSSAHVSVTNFERREDGFEGDAEVSLKTATLLTPLDFSIAYDDQKALMRGTASLSRKALDLGQSSDPGGDWVSPDIEVSVEVHATRK